MQEIEVTPTFFGSCSAGLFGFTSSAVVTAARGSKTTRSSRESAPRRSAPWTEAQSVHIYIYIYPHRQQTIPERSSFQPCAHPASCIWLGSHPCCGKQLATMGAGLLATSIPAEIFAVSELPGKRSVSVSRGRWSSCNKMWSLQGPTPRPSRISTVMARHTTTLDARPLASGAAKAMIRLPSQFRRIPASPRQPSVSNTARREIPVG